MALSRFRSRTQSEATGPSRLPSLATVALTILVLAPPSLADLPGAQRPLADPGHDIEADAQDLAPGKFLVASRKLRDTHFARTVVLLLDYDRDGALGLIVNRRTPLRVASVFPRLGELDRDKHSVFEGGPVDRRSLLMLVRTELPSEGAVPVFGDVYVSASVDLLEKLMRAGRTSDFRVFSGYAGWGAGQLDREVDRDSWHIIDAEEALVFDAEPDSTWERVVPIDPLQWTDRRVPEFRFDIAQGIARPGQPARDAGR